MSPEPPEEAPPGPHGPEDQQALARLEDELHSARPLPSPATRSRIRTMITSAGLPRSRPTNLRGLVAVYACAGVLLLLVGVLGALGVGPV